MNVYLTVAALYQNVPIPRGMAPRAAPPLMKVVVLDICQLVNLVEASAAAHLHLSFVIPIRRFRNREILRCPRDWQAKDITEAEIAHAGPLSLGPNAALLWQFLHTTLEQLLSELPSQIDISPRLIGGSRRVPGSHGVARLHRPRPACARMEPRNHPSDGASRKENRRRRLRRRLQGRSAGAEGSITLARPPVHCSPARSLGAQSARSDYRGRVGYIQVPRCRTCFCANLVTPAL